MNEKMSKTNAHFEDFSARLVLRPFPRLTSAHG